MFHKLSFVNKRHEGGDVYTFFFARPQGFRYDAGKHAIFLLPGLYRPHPFSISSAPDEEYIAITTHTGTGSRYKNRLLSIQPGDAMWCVGPVMKFTFTEDTARYVFLAQGIGVTPFRSMLVHAANHLPNVEMTLVHVDGGEHLFRSETQQLATHAYYPADTDSFRDAIRSLDSGGRFYISGSPSFIKSTTALLHKKGIDSSDIMTDSFLGY